MSSSVPSASRLAAAGAGIPPLASADRWLIGLFALAKLLVHLAAINGYGYFRDEFYYLACAEHPALGYVDHPPLSVLLLDIVRHTLGDSRPALRLLPALAGAGTVALVGLMAHALGGRRRALMLSMTAALVAPVYLALDHFYSMNAFDLLAWPLIAWMLIRLIAGAPLGIGGRGANGRTNAGAANDAQRRAAAGANAEAHAEAHTDAHVDAAAASDAPALRPLPWIWFGVALGAGLMNKISILWLGAGLFAGLLASRETRGWLRTPWPWVAGLIAAVLFSPYVLWQVQHDWATLEFMRNATGTKMAAVSPLAFLTGQIKTMLPFTLPVWLAGLWYLFADPDGRRYRPLGWTFIVVFVILAASGSSRANYLAPAYTWLFAAGGVAWERWTRAAADLPSVRSPRWLPLTWLPTAMTVFLLIAGALIAPLGLPLLPVDRYIAYAAALGERPSTEEKKELAALPQFYADMHGWEAMVSTIAEAYHRLPPDDQRVARIFAQDYGVAGAIDLLGRRQGLPGAISGHNNYWLWGPGDWDGRVLIVVGGREATLREQFTQVDRAGTIDCGLCMPYENGMPVWIARGLHRPVAELWPRTKHYE